MGVTEDAVKAAPAINPRLLQRGLPVTTYYLRGADPDEVEAAEQAVAEAKDTAEIAAFRLDPGGDAAREGAEVVLREARATLAACYDPIKIRALPPEVYEGLIAEHKNEASDTGVDDDSLARAVFLAGVVGDLTDEDWDLILAQCSLGERNGLLGAAIRINIRGTDGAIPKD